MYTKRTKISLQTLHIYQQLMIYIHTKSNSKTPSHTLDKFIFLIHLVTGFAQESKKNMLI